MGNSGQAMRVEITDATWVKPATYGPFERVALRYLKDERDLIFVRTMAGATLTIMPMALVLFLSPPWLVGLLALPYVGWVFLAYAARYGLMLHANGHRPIFKREYRWMSGYVPWVLGPFFGHTPTSFSAHHMWMHHAENNMEGDGSSTLAYRRDSFLHFLHYWARFFFLGYVHLSRYLVLRGRYKTAWRFFVGESFWYVLAAVALWLNWAAALVVFIGPFLLMRWLLMAGNFAQHAFVDVDDPDNPYRNSNCLINARYNHKAYNDGYHIVHHIRPGMHWSEMPQWFLDHYDRFVEQDAVVFDGLGDNQQVFWLLMTRRYDTLAEHLVDFRGRTHEQKVEMLKSRVQRRRGTMPRFFHLETRVEASNSRRMTEPELVEALTLGGSV